MKEEEPYDYSANGGDSTLAGGNFDSSLSCDYQEASMQSQQDDLVASGELTNAQISELDDEDSRLEGEIASIRGDIDLLCSFPRTSTTLSPVCCAKKPIATKTDTNMFAHRRL